MTYLHPARSDPPRTLAQRIEKLNDNLEILRSQLKDEIAKAVSVAVADAVRDAVRSLLGRDTRMLTQDPTPDGLLEDRRWNEPEEKEDLWQEEQDVEPEEDFLVPHPTENTNRWQQALRTALSTGLWWLKRQSSSRPILTTALVAVAGGVTALLAGPAIAASAVALVSAASLVMTAETAGSATSGIAALVAG